VSPLDFGEIIIKENITKFLGAIVSAQATMEIKSVSSQNSIELKFKFAKMVGIWKEHSQTD